MPNRANSRCPGGILIIIRLLRDRPLPEHLAMLGLVSGCFVFVVFNGGVCLFSVVFAPFPSFNPQTHPHRELVSENSRNHAPQS